MDRDELRQKFSPLLDGELSAEERAVVEGELAQDSELLRELDSLKRVDDLFHRLPTAKAPAGFEESVRRRLKPKVLQFTGKPFGRPRWIAAVAAAAVVLLIGGVALVEWRGGVGQFDTFGVQRKPTESAAELRMAKAEPTASASDAMAQQALPEPAPPPAPAAAAPAAAGRDLNVAADFGTQSPQHRSMGLESADIARKRAAPGQQAESLERPKSLASTSAVDEVRLKAVPRENEESMVYQRGPLEKAKTKDSSQQKGAKEPAKPAEKKAAETSNSMGRLSIAPETRSDVDKADKQAPATENLPSLEAYVEPSKDAPQAAPATVAAKPEIKPKGAEAELDKKNVNDYFNYDVNGDSAETKQMSPAPPLVVSSKPAPATTGGLGGGLGTEGPRRRAGLEESFQTSPTGSASARRSNNEVAAALPAPAAAPAPASAPPPSVFMKSLPDTKRILGKRVFELKEGTWRQSGYKDETVVVLTRNSDVFKNLIKKDADLKPLEQFDKPVIFNSGERWYRLEPPKAISGK